MADERTIRALERLIIEGGAITGRAATVHPDVQVLSLTQYRALALVATAPDGLRVAELARRKGRAPQATSKVTQRLEARGLVWLERGAEADRRAVIVRLTELGERVWADLSTQRRELLAAALAGADLPAGAGDMLETISEALGRHSP